jgi:hypothetical protein
MLASPTGFEPRVYAMSVASSWATRRRGLRKLRLNDLMSLTGSAPDLDHVQIGTSLVILVWMS